MNKQLFAILALSSLIIPYQNCSNQIAFESQSLEKVAEIVDQANNEALDEAQEIANPDIVDNNEEEEEIVDSPVIDDKEERCLGVGCHEIDPPIHVDPLPEARCNYMNIYAKVNGTKLKLGSAKVYNAKEISLDENMRYQLNGPKDYSVHPKIGPVIDGKSTKMYLIRSIEGVSLNVVFNQYNGGSSLNRVKMKLNVSNNSGLDKVLFFEDQGTDRYIYKEKSDSNSYDFTFNYSKNTDSFAVGPLDHEEAILKIQAVQMGDAAEKSLFYSADGNHVELFQKEGTGLAQIEVLGCQMNTVGAEPPIDRKPSSHEDDKDCDKEKKRN